MFQKRTDRGSTSLISARFLDTQGQITIFIILGIVLLLAVALVIMLKTEVIQFNPEEIIPTEKGKIENYITQCMSSIGDKALLQIGLQGGYIDVPAEIARDGALHLRLSPM